MRKVYCLLAAVVVTLVFGVVFFREVRAASDIEITPNATEHTIAMPYEKSFLFVATIKNNSDKTKNVQTMIEGEVPEKWHLLAVVGQHELAPGQQNDYIAVFEPGMEPGDTFKEEAVTVSISFSWEGGLSADKAGEAGSKKFDVTVKTKQLLPEEKKEDSSKVAVSVVDKATNKTISGASVLAILPSGIEQFEARPGKEGYLLTVPSGDYLEKINEEYEINQASVGYLFQVSAKGYKSYFESDFLPSAGNSEKTITLEPLDKVGEYKLEKTVKSGYSIWWIRASADNKYFAFSQGAHGQPGQEPPSQTKVLLTNEKGETIWEKTTGGECWGLDISPSGQYVSAGCGDSKIHVWDREGNQVWQYDAGSEVRWVKFSPDNNYLLSGPVENKPEKSGLFEASSGKLLWSFFTGDWLREGQFSSDSSIVYLASANGTLYALDTSSGDLKWLGAGDYVIPFIIGSAEEAGLVITAGKGRAFTALTLATGKHKWQATVDQTITAGQVARDGSVVGSTVGGMAYGLNADGKFIWARQQGGVGHNAVHYTQDGHYAFFGGSNPTLFDRDGNVLWQREPDKKIEMTGPAEQDTGGANEVWMSDDASLLIVGQDDGDIQFYKGEIKQGANNYSQLTGDFAGRQKFIPFKDAVEPEEEEEDVAGEVEGIPLYWLVLLIAGGIIGVTVFVGSVAMIVKLRSKKDEV